MGVLTLFTLGMMYWNRVRIVADEKANSEK